MRMISSSPCVNRGMIVSSAGGTTNVRNIPHFMAAVNNKCGDFRRIMAAAIRETVGDSAESGHAIGPTIAEFRRPDWLSHGCGLPSRLTETAEAYVAPAVAARPASWLARLPQGTGVGMPGRNSESAAAWLAARKYLHA